MKFVGAGAVPRSPWSDESSPISGAWLLLQRSKNLLRPTFERPSECQLLLHHAVVVLTSYHSLARISCVEITSASDRIELKKQASRSTDIASSTIVHKQSIESELLSHIIGCYWFCKSQWNHALYVHWWMARSPRANYYNVGAYRCE